jgi:hypothetical protein
MKFLKGLLYVVLALVAIYLVAAAILPKTYTISVTETINAPKATVLAYATSLKNQEQYSEWIRSDKTNKLIYTGTDGTVGASQAWTGETAGQGSQTITTLTDSSVAVALNFIKPFEDQAKGLTIVRAKDANSCTVESQFIGEDPFPMNAMGLLSGMFMIEPTEIQNLKNMKAILEKK